MLYQFYGIKIRENITPRGDGNYNYFLSVFIANVRIRENITPRGDGNSIKRKMYKNNMFLNKREYNSERRRKHF